VPIVDCGFSQAAATAAGITPEDALVRLGPTLQVDIGFDPALFGQALPPIPGATVPPLAISPISVPALLDTGAQESSIDEDLAQQLKLPLIDQETRSGISGPIVLNVYLAHIVIPTVGTQYGRFTGVYLQKGGQFHKALIGRTMLSDMLLVYDGRNGSVQLAR